MTKKIPEKIKPILEEVKKGVMEVYGDRLKGIILSGSYARGDADEGSESTVLKGHGRRYFWNGSHKEKMVVSKLGFFVEYRDSQGNHRAYYPDFIILTKKNGTLIVETKGREDVDIEHKDKRIKLWCEDATKLTKSKWAFIRVDQEDFERYRFKSIEELILSLKDE